MTPVSTSYCRVRLKCLLMMCALAVVLYLIIHLYIGVRLTRNNLDIATDNTRHVQKVIPVLTCRSPPQVESVIKRMPDQPVEGVFYVPVGPGRLHPEHGGVPLVYNVDERFPPLLSFGETEHLMRLVRKLAALLSGAGVTFTMWRGSVLGSFMTHGLLPWDDDVDFAIRWIDMPKVKFALRNFGSMWRVYNVTSYHDDTDLYSRALLTSNDVWGRSIPNPAGTPRYHRFKFFAVDSSIAGNSTWKWPYIDVVFFHENATHVWTHAEPKNTNYIPRGIFYPLHPRPLGALWLPAPAQTHAYLTLYYSRHFQCSKAPHNHRRERMQPSISVPCCALYWTYPVVLREPGFGRVLETLMLGNETLHVVFVREHFVPNVGPYKL